MYDYLSPAIQLIVSSLDMIKTDTTSPSIMPMWTVQRLRRLRCSKFTDNFELVASFVFFQARRLQKFTKTNVKFLLWFVVKIEVEVMQCMGGNGKCLKRAFLLIFGFFLHGFHERKPMFCNMTCAGSRNGLLPFSLG